MKEVTRRHFFRMSWIAAAAVFIISMAVYGFTAEPTVSFWDCPEYVTTAARLEPGHPPGNPVWMLTARMFTLLAPDASLQAYAVNLMSGVCSALAVMYLCLTISVMCRNLLLHRRRPFTARNLLVCLAGGVTGSLCFAFCDSFWFSAVEAEVYAFSSFMTALIVWLAIIAGENRGDTAAKRYIILLAYLTGLSIGIHQLNLLCLPALALILVFYRYDSLKRRTVLIALIVSVMIIASVLFGMMPASIKVAQHFELLAVNGLGMAPQTGLIAYLVLTFLLIIVAAVMSRSRRKIVSFVLGCVALFLSGAVSFGASLPVGAILSAASLTLLILFRHRVDMARYETAMWSLGVLLLGFCSYGVIMIRAAANPPMNQGDASNIFAFESYLMREQYGSTSLLKGPTPNSKPLRREVMTTDATGMQVATYPDYYKDFKAPKYTLVTSGGKPHYEIAGYQEEYRYPPELDMWFPRINKGTEMSVYEGWTSLRCDSLEMVEASYAVDSLGNAVGKYDNITGERTRQKVGKPSWWNNLEMLFGYQISYMYMRYLMWNFVGRQNDYYAQGEADAGNFITGIAPIDDLMLENPGQAPAAQGKENPGRRAFYFIPLIIGIFGIIFQLSHRVRGKRQFTVVLLLFILTGLAIVVYLNQSPSQPRERDYSFVGSFYAFCIWIGLGIAGLVNLAAERKSRFIAPLVAVCSLALPAWMFAESLPDHNRRCRTAARDHASNILLPLEKDALIFVNGDNYTFPLWYIQEVEGVRRDVRTINLAYLSTPWYIRQLASPTADGKRVAMVLPDSINGALAEERLRVVRFVPGEADAVEALESLYRGEREDLPAQLRLAPYRPDADSLVIDLAKVAPGSIALTRDKLTMVDILAANAAAGWKRPVYWNSTLRLSNMASLNKSLRQIALAYRLDPAAPQQHRPSLDVEATTRAILSQFRFGGFDEGKGVYADPPSRTMISELRRLVIRTAGELLDVGNPGEAVKLADLCRTKLSEESSPYSVTLDRVMIFNEGVELANIYLRAYRATGDRHLLSQAREIIKREAEKSVANYRFIESLSPRYRKYTMSRTRLARLVFAQPFEAWLDAGGSLADFAALTKGIDMNKERRATEKEITRRLLLDEARDAAAYSPDSPEFATFSCMLSKYAALGGTREELAAEAEFAQFPFVLYNF